MNRCEEFEILASAAIDEEVTADELTTLFCHLATCHRCASFFISAVAVQVAAAREGITPLPSDRPLPVGPPVRRYEHTAFRSIVRSVIRKRVSIPMPVFGFLAVLMVVIIMALSESREMIPMERPVQKSGVNQAILRFPVIRIP